MDGLTGSPSVKPLWRRRRLWAGTLAVLVGLSGTAVWLRQSGQKGRNLDPYTVLARQGSLPSVVSASGELDAVRRVNVSPKRQGLLQELYVEEGDRVRQGQALALMDSGDLNERLKELQANLSSAEAQLARTRSEWERRRQLFASQAISADDYQRALGAFHVDEANVAAARQRLEQRQVERDELIVRAPFDGVITQRFADPGAFVTPTTTASATAGATSSSVVELAQGLEVLAKVPENDIGRLRVGQMASVRVDAFPDQRFAARVRRIAPRAIKLNNVTSFEVKLQLIDPPPELRIGMTADIDFQAGQLRSETLVPTVAVVTEAGKPGVLRVGPEREPTFQPVELGSSSGKDTQIITGLKPGERVFIDLPPWASKRPQTD
ncbi:MULTISPECIES: efflux RND transporter periplasmic adaptor subunit [unclassified Synechococcus]|uniref:efflux RND transporter periplasmic adaptor subunit n=1 Tax=unclassified Synechococcus TaxID=2626047 RepID=UPI0018CDDFA5|nr:efflux RND transporter periplasmic adaptor subunit [Synechococcus sp. CBW1002]